MFLSLKHFNTFVIRLLCLLHVASSAYLVKLIMKYVITSSNKMHIWCLIKHFSNILNRICRTFGSDFNLAAW